MFEEFREMLTEYVDVPAEEITPDSRFIEDLGLNSFEFMTMLGNLEDQYDVEVDENEILGIKTVGEAVSYIEKLSK